MGSEREQIERLTSNPKLRPHEWADFASLVSFRKQDIAAMIGIEPESFSRILGGKPASIATEKMFRLIMVCELMRPALGCTEAERLKNAVEQSVIMKVICSLDLSPMEIVASQGDHLPTDNG